jgi:aryl-alcohol dehydrogenase-like predicted oxidoreductase
MAAVVQRTSDKSHGVRRLGFGVSGPHGTPLMAAERTYKLIEHAFTRGIRLFDTAPAYGNGEAERRLGEAMKGLPRYECIISTKAGITSSGLARRKRDFSPDAIRRSLDASRKRMNLARIDWLLLHGPASHELTDQLVKTLVDMKYGGEVAAIGIATRGEAVNEALATGVFTVFMTPVHAGVSTEHIERLRRIKASGAELIGIEALTPAQRKFPAPVSAGSTWRLARALMGRTQSSGTATPMSPEECLYWALFEAVAHRVVTTTTRMEHLEANIHAVEVIRSGRVIAR